MSERKAHRVGKLELEELSIVDNPANPGARSVLVKRAGGASFWDRLKELVTKSDTDAASFDAIRFRNEVERATWPILDALNGSVRSILADQDVGPEQRATLLDRSLSEFRAAVLALPTLQLAALDTEAAAGSSVNKKGAAVTLEEAMAKIKELEGQLAEAKKGDGGKPVEKAVEAAPLDPAVAERLTKAETEAADLRKQLSDMEEREATRDRLSKAAVMVKGTPVKADEVAGLLAKLDAAGVTVLESMLKAHAEVLDSLRLFKEVGELSDGTVDAQAQLDKAVEDFRKAHPTLTREQAEARVISSNPALYEALTTVEG